MDSGEFPCRSIEKLCRDCFRQGVIAFLLPSRNQVISVLLDHPVKLRNLIRAILQVCIHRDHHIALRTLETAMQPRRLAIIAPETDPPYCRRLLPESFDDIPRAIGTSIVHKYNLIRKMIFRHHPLDPSK